MVCVLSNLVSLIQKITMATLAYVVLAVLATALFLIFYSFRNNNDPPWSWPIVGCLPSIFLSSQSVADRVAQVLEASNGTIIVKCARFVDRDILLTSDPANVRHMMVTKFSNYPKGKEWKKRFDLFGEGAFNLDFEEWMYYRGLLNGFFSHQKFQQFWAKINRESFDQVLVPALEHVSSQGIVVNLHDLFCRHIFYIACRIATGYSPNSIGYGFQENEFSKAFEGAYEAIFFRQLSPECFWKLQRWLGVGKEKKLKEAATFVEIFFAKCVSKKREEISKGLIPSEDENFSALNNYLTGHETAGPIRLTDEVVKDNLLALMLAVQDTASSTLSWFFWLLSKNPFAETQIRGEISRCASSPAKWHMYGNDELGKMVYLHAALSETLRLFPPVPFQSRSPLQPDTLPSNHRVNQKTNAIISTYAMGRMSCIWGNDCHEFKPERWITKEGKIKHEPHYKFFAFNAGPRICPGQNMAFRLMTTIAANIIKNYQVQVVDNHPVIPKSSIILHMKHGLLATVQSI